MSISRNRPASEELVFVGTGEALDPELPNTSLLVCGPQTILLDCGYAVPHAFWKISRDVDRLDAIWISHTHADHVFGLPALLLWMRLGGRKRPLTLLCGPGQASKLEQLLELGYPGSYAPHKCYPIEYIELDREGVSRFRDFDLRIAPSAHSVVNYALRLESPGLRSLVYSGDGFPTEATRELCRGVSVLVHECFFPGANGDRKHGGVDSCLELAHASAVQTLALLHFAGEAKTAITEQIQARSGDPFEIVLPRPGDVLPLGNHP
jgi:ribonuclease Z